LLTLAYAARIVVHVVGWLERAQPPIETFEIPLYIVLTIATAWLRFAGC